MGLVRTLAVASALSAIPLGCGAAGNAVQDRPATQVACSLAMEYRSLAQLRRDATSVAVAQPTGAVTVRRIGGIPSDDATVKLLSHVAGGPLPWTFTLRDVADPKLVGDSGCAPVVSRSNAYLLYLMPFRRRRNGPAAAGRYVVVGGPQGVFVHIGTPPPSDPAQRSFVHQQSDVGRALPQRISIADARRSAVQR
jgi:hypothetical protein